MGLVLLSLLARVMGSNRRRVIALTFVMVSFTLSLQAIVPLLPRYADDIGLSGSQLGWVYAVYPLAVIPTLLVLSPLSDHLGRKPLLLAALLASTGTCALLATADSLSMLLAGRILHGVGMGLYWATAMAWLRDLIPDERRDDSSLLMSAILMSANCLGILLFGTISQVGDSTTLPWVLLGVVLTAAVILVTLVPEDRSEPRRWIRPRVTITSPVGRSREFYVFIGGGIFVCSAMSMTLFSMSAPALQDLAGGSAMVAGAILAAGVGAGAVVQIFTRRTDPGMLVIRGWVAESAGLGAAWIGFSTESVGIVIIGYLLTGAGAGSALRGLLALAERMTHEKNRATVLSSFTAFMYAGHVVPLATGPLLDRWGIATAVAVLALVGGMLLAALAAGWRPLGRSDLRAAERIFALADRPEMETL